jgi:hypothetical protein
MKVVMVTVVSAFERAGSLVELDSAIRFATA